MTTGSVMTPKQMQDAVDALERSGNNKVAAAASLGLNINTFKYRLKSARDAGVAPTPGLRVGLDDRRKIKTLTEDLRLMQERLLTDETIKRRIIGLANDAATTPPPEWVSRELPTADAPGVPTLFCSDWHCGEVVEAAQVNNVNAYDIKIFRERVRALVDTSIHLLKILDPKMRYPGIVLPLGGDMVSGNIHEELTATNEINSMPTVLELFGILKWVVSTMAEKFGKVFLPCVTGNHGRNTMKIWNKDRHATSFDWLLYQLLAHHFEGDARVTFQIPDGPDAYYRIYNHRYLLTHGDQFRGGDGLIGCLGPIIRGDHKKRSRNAQIDMEYDTMLLGHWHQYIHHSRVIVNGSLKGYDEYAYSNNFGFEPPRQALWVTHPRHSITYAMAVQVDRKKEPAKTEWVSFAK